MLWTWSQPKIDYDTLLSFQKVNHFRNARVITRKDNLKKSIDRYGKLGGKYAEFFDIMPATFILPEYIIIVIMCF